MEKEKINFIISAILTMGTLILTLLFYWIDCKCWFFLFVKDIMVGIFSGTIVSTIVLYFVLRNSIIETNNEFCYCLDELLEPYEYLLDLGELPFSIGEERCWDILQSIDKKIQKLKYEKLFKKETIRSEVIIVKIIALRVVLKKDSFDKETILNDYIEILHIIEKISKKPSNFAIEQIKQNCKRKLLVVERYND